MQGIKEFISGRIHKEQAYAFLAVCACIAAVFCSALIMKNMSFWTVPSFVPRILCLGLMGLMILFCLKFSERELKITILLFLYLCGYVLFSRNNVTGYLMTVAGSFLVFLLLIISAVNGNRLGTLLNCFKNVVLFMAAFSLFFWIFGTLLRVLPGRTAVRYHFYSRNFRAYTYGYVYYDSPVQSITVLGKKLYRNILIFSEAPSFSSYLVYALLIEIGGKRPKIWKLAVLTAALLTTLSAKSYIFLIEIVLLVYWSKPMQRHSRQAVIRMFVMIGMVVLAAGGVFMIFRVKSDMSSYTNRIASMAAGVQTWLNHPLFGAGYGDSSEIVALAGLTTGATNTSMGLTTLLGQGGLYLFVFYLLPYGLAAKQAYQTRYFRIFILTAVISLTDLFISRIMYSVYYQVIIAMGYCAWITRGKMFRAEDALQ